MKIICEKDLCTGCGCCVDTCAHQAITMRQDTDGFLFPVINQDLCIDCGLCVKNCPVKSPERIRSNKLRDIEVREGWSLVDSIRLASSSGGIFGQLAYDLLKDGWLVCGVAFDGHKAYHKLIDSINDLPELQNTKYVQSNTTSIYKQVLFELKRGRNVFFSGTPCQVAACYSFLYKKKYTGNLFTLEVICHGVPTYLILDESVQYNKAIAVDSFRNKDKGWGYHSQTMKYLFENQKIKSVSRDRDLFYRYFFSEKMLRASCSSCPYARCPRVADITIGDSWNTRNPLKKEISKGLSLIVINNKYGYQQLLNNNNIQLKKLGWLSEIEINRNLYTPFPPQKGSFAIKRIEHPKDFLMKHDDIEFLQDTPLGINEKKLHDNLLKKIVRKFISVLVPVLAGNGEIENFSYMRMKSIIILRHLYSHISVKQSDRYISKAFTLLLENVYRSKKVR